jgi:hypothetical protein
MLNHAHDTRDMLIDAIRAELPGVAASRLLVAYGMFIQKQNNFTLPFDIQGKQINVGVGAEAFAIFKAITEELGSRLDHIPVA